MSVLCWDHVLMLWVAVVGQNRGLFSPKGVSGVKQSRSALGLDTKLRHSCLKKLLQRFQRLTNWPPHGDSLIIVLQKLSNTLCWSRHGFGEEEGVRGSCGMLRVCCDLSSCCCRCLQCLMCLWCLMTTLAL